MARVLVYSRMSSPLARKYKFAGTLGEGSTGVVHAGRLQYDLGAGQKHERACAVKVMHESRVEDAEARQAFAEEALRGYELCVHPNLVVTRAMGATPGGRMYMVMDQAHETLAQLMPGRVSAPLVRAVAVAILRALDHLHKAGLAHADVHAGNVFLYLDGAIRLGDLSHSGPLGSRTGCDARADFRRLGLLLLQLITGELAFRWPHEIRPVPTSAPADLRLLLGHLLPGAPPDASGEPERALPSAAQLCELLDDGPGAIADAAAVIAWMDDADEQPAEPAPRSGPAVAGGGAPGRRARAGWYAAGAVALVALVATALSSVWVGYALARAHEERAAVGEGAHTGPVVASSAPERPGEKARAGDASRASGGSQIVDDRVYYRASLARPEQVRTPRDERAGDGVARPRIRAVSEVRGVETEPIDIADLFMAGADRFELRARGRNSAGLAATVDRAQWLDNGDVLLNLFVHNGGADDYRLADIQLVDGHGQLVASVRVERFLAQVENSDLFVRRIPHGEMAQAALRLSRIRARSDQTVTLWISEAAGQRPVEVHFIWP